MVQGAASETEHKIIAILKVLNESSEPLGSITIARELERHGISLSERAVQISPRITDERGHTQPFGRDGRMLTAQGLEELKIALAPEHVGFVLEKLETLAFQTTFNPKTRTGLVPINTSLIAKDKLKKALAIIDEAVMPVFASANSSLWHAGRKTRFGHRTGRKSGHRHNLQRGGKRRAIQIRGADFIKIRRRPGIENPEKGTFRGDYLLRRDFTGPIGTIHPGQNDEREGSGEDRERPDTGEFPRNTRAVQGASQ